MEYDFAYSTFEDAYKPLDSQSLIPFWPIKTKYLSYGGPWNGLLRAYMPMVYVGVIMATVSYFMTVLQCVCEIRVMHLYEDVASLYNSKEIIRFTLPDIFFEFLPEMPYWAADAYLWSIVAPTIIRFTFGVTPSGFRIRRHIFRRHILVLAILYFFRCFTIICTQLPVPNPDCTTEVNGTNSIWYDAIRILMGQDMTCADVVYSGHTMIMVSSGMVWHMYSHVVPITLIDPLFSWAGPVTDTMGTLQRMTTVKFLVWIYVSLGVLCIVATRRHFSLDCIVSVLVTVFVYYTSIHEIHTAHLKKNIFGRFLMYMELGAADTLYYQKRLQIAEIAQNMANDHIREHVNGSQLDLSELSIDTFNKKLTAGGIETKYSS